MNTDKTWLLYGATGYTGRKIAQETAARGLRPILAGRDAVALRELGEALHLEWQAVALNDTAALHALVARCSAVLHAAGPFVDTWQPMVEACLASGTHYLDLTGEIPVYEAQAALDARARAAGVMLMPGVGFDMVPGDCLALYLKRVMPDAIALDMGISFEGTMTRGTIRSALRSFSPAARVRREHALVALAEPAAREFDFGPGACGGRSLAYAMDFGDVSIGWRTTGIANINCYLRPSKEFAALAGITSDADVAKLPAGPSADELQNFPSILVAEVRNAAGERRAARLVLPQIYAITATLAADIAERVARGTARAGFQTPAPVFGEDFILGFAGCTRQDWPASPAGAAA